MRRLQQPKLQRAGLKSLPYIKLPHIRYVRSLQAVYKRPIRLYGGLRLLAVIFAMFMLAFSFNPLTAKARQPARDQIASVSFKAPNKPQFTTFVTANIVAKARNIDVAADRLRDGGPDSGPEPITAPPAAAIPGLPVPTPTYQADAFPAIQPTPTVPALLDLSEESTQELNGSQAQNQDGSQPGGLDQQQPPVASATVTPTSVRAAADELSGNLRWTKDKSPVIITTDQRIPAGSSLVIDPGVEVRFAPDTRMLIEGKLRAEGSTAEPVRLTGMDNLWDSLVGTDSSSIVLEHVQISQAGSSGTALSSAGGTLVIRDAALSDSSGGIAAISSTLTISNTEIMSNTLDGSALRVQLPIQGTTKIIGNRIGDNRVPEDTPQVFLSGGSITNTLELAKNLFIGRDSPAVVLNSDTPLKGTIRCNTFKDGTIGLQLRTNLLDTTGFALEITDNAFISQTDYGVTGTLPFDVTHNWWGAPSGPFAALRNQQGRGVHSGVNIQFQPWRIDRPVCTPNK